MSQATSFDKVTFMTNFQGMEDLAHETIRSFLSTLPILLSAVEAAIQSKNAEELELSAHTLKGAASNFYAEPSRALAFQLEKMGHESSVDGADKVLAELKIAVTKLTADLNVLLNERKAA